MDLKAAVGLNVGELVAFVGAGGKTTAAWLLLRSLVDSGERAVFTTTTRIFQPKEVALILDPNPDPEEIAHKLTKSQALVLAAGRGESGDPARAARSPYAADPVKLVGLEPQVLDDLARRLPEVTWLVEADGAKGRLLKAPAEYEPVIPARAGRVIVVAGLDAIGKPLDGRTVHRPEIAARLLGVSLGAAVTPQMFAELIGHPAGGLKGIPDSAEVVVLLAQWDDCSTIYADTIARHLLSERRIRRVVLVNLRSPGAALEIWIQH
ncbi:MAG: putative selenium-dependent hydroxylase accessory protein YqeC [Chloroflexi bacterium]|nr:putative selenium-dependent hydroxylase accessory protein YqeC [Chloroflexota bacterium]